VLSDAGLLLLLAYGICILSLAPALTLSGYCCQQQYTVRRLVLWLVLWIGFATMAGVLAVHLSGTAFRSVEPHILAFFLIQLIVVSVVLGGLLYLANLPFMLAASKRSQYGVFLTNALLTESLSENPAESLPRPSGKEAGTSSEIGPENASPGLSGVTSGVACDRLISAGPTTKPVRAADIAGAWQFYLDRVSRTVVVDLKPDGTFDQAILPNHGARVECAGGTWMLDGPRVCLDHYVMADGGTSGSRTWWVANTPVGFAVFGGDGPQPECFLYRTSRAWPTAFLSASKG
jgi:hypothetical protein